MKTLLKTSMLALSLVSTMAMAANKPTLVQHMQGTPAPMVAGKSASNATSYMRTHIKIINDENFPVTISLPESDSEPVYLAPQYACGNALECNDNTDVIEDPVYYWDSVEVKIFYEGRDKSADVYNHSTYLVSELIGFGAKAKAK